MKEFDFTGNSGILKCQLNNFSRPFDIYSHLFGERLLDLIVAETNIQYMPNSYGYRDALKSKIKAVCMAADKTE